MVEAQQEWVDTEAESGRQTSRQADRQTGRQADRQTGKINGQVRQAARRAGPQAVGPDPVTDFFKMKNGCSSLS